MSIIRRVRKICVFIGSHSCKVLAVNWAPCTHSMYMLLAHSEVCSTETAKQEQPEF